MPLFTFFNSFCFYLAFIYSLCILLLLGISVLPSCFAFYIA